MHLRVVNQPLTYEQRQLVRHARSDHMKERLKAGGRIDRLPGSRNQYRDPNDGIQNGRDRRCNDCGYEGKRYGRIPGFDCPTCEAYLEQLRSRNRAYKQSVRNGIERCGARKAHGGYCTFRSKIQVMVDGELVWRCFIHERTGATTVSGELNGSGENL